MHSYIALSKSNLIHNIRALREHLYSYQGNSHKKVIAVVKANAYGHGMDLIAPALNEYVDAFAVDDVLELVALRKITNLPIHVLGYISPDEIQQALMQKPVLAVYDTRMLTYINECASKQHTTAQVNLKIDALLGRQGVLIDELPTFIAALKECQHVWLEGVYAHFANMEDTTDTLHSQKQADTFRKACQTLDENGYTGYARHISSTAAALLYDGFHPEYTHVRLGIGIYGIWPSQLVQERCHTSLTLSPVLSWISQLAQVKEVPAGFPVGYGCTYITKQPSRIGVVPQGYSDGYDRKLSDTGSMIVRGTRCPVIGRVAMNMCVVDVTDASGATAGDEVVLLGKQGRSKVTVHELAHLSGSMAYEVLSRLSPCIPRRLV